MANSSVVHSQPSLRSDSSPWAWRPIASPWFLRFLRSASKWRPSPELELDAEPLIEAMVDAAGREERWLLHPCVNPLTLGGPEARLQRDFQLAAWVAGHSDGPFGTVRVLEDLWAWSPDGAAVWGAGRHDLAEVGKRAGGHAWPVAIAFDVWGRSITATQEHWFALPPESDEEEGTLRSETVRFLRACKAAERGLAVMYDWMTSMTQVAVPMRRTGGRYSKSSSSRQLPGLVCLTLHDEAQVLEALAHETAHNYLFLAEVMEPLVDPGHAELYPSPLRADKRPLLGVLLAYHALAYIGAYYTDALRGKVIEAGRCEAELTETRRRLADAERTLSANGARLTENGRAFLDRTMRVASYCQDAP